MKTRTIKKGFSLTEVLMAMGIFTIAMLFIAAVFPVAIRFTNISTDRINAAAATDEALAKVRLYGSLDTSWTKKLYVNECNDFNNVRVDTDWAYLKLLPDVDYRYPSVAVSQESGRYYWSALCRWDPNVNCVKTTIFISKPAGNNALYYQRDKKQGNLLNTLWANFEYPRLVAVEVEHDPNVVAPDELKIINNSTVNEESFVNAGDTIVCDSDGLQYRVLERYASSPQVIKLDKVWQGKINDFIWLIPGPVGPSGPSGKSNCVYVSPPFPVSF